MHDNQTKSCCDFIPMYSHLPLQSGS